jgi:hypothetical protein
MDDFRANNWIPALERWRSSEGTQFTFPQKGTEAHKTAIRKKGASKEWISTLRQERQETGAQFTFPKKGTENYKEVMEVKGKMDRRQKQKKETEKIVASFEPITTLSGITQQAEKLSKKVKPQMTAVAKYTPKVLKSVVKKYQKKKSEEKPVEKAPEKIETKEERIARLQQNLPLEVVKNIMSFIPEKKFAKLQKMLLEQIKEWKFYAVDYNIETVGSDDYFREEEEQLEELIPHLEKLEKDVESKTFFKYNFEAKVEGGFRWSDFRKLFGRNSYDIDKKRDIRKISYYQFVMFLILSTQDEEIDWVARETWQSNGNYDNIEFWAISDCSKEIEEMRLDNKWYDMCYKMSDKLKDAMKELLTKEFKLTPKAKAESLSKYVGKQDDFEYYGDLLASEDINTQISLSFSEKFKEEEPKPQPTTTETAEEIKSDKSDAELKKMVQSWLKDNNRIWKGYTKRPRQTLLRFLKSKGVEV